LRVLRSRFALGAAEVLGRALRATALSARSAGLSALGAGLVCGGLMLAWPPLGVIALGCAVLAIDRGRAR
jgi:asparagine N-glycosylation enzyme membrane subunit Stt3